MPLPTCRCCGAKASVMRRDVVTDGDTAKPGDSRWYCKVHAPPPAIPASEFKPFEDVLKGMMKCESK